MLLWVQIDLSGADIASFEAYEERVFALLPEHGGRLERRLRALDGRSEVHLIAFADLAGLRSFREDPRRAAAQELWQRAGATSSITEVRDLLP